MLIALTIITLSLSLAGGRLLAIGRFNRMSFGCNYLAPLCDIIGCIAPVFNRADMLPPRVINPRVPITPSASAVRATGNHCQATKRDHCRQYKPFHNYKPFILRGKLPLFAFWRNCQFMPLNCQIVNVDKIRADKRP